jgi:Beta-mannanase
MLVVSKAMSRRAGAVVNDDVLFAFRLRLFSLAAETGNVRAACRTFAPRRRLGNSRRALVLEALGRQPVSLGSNVSTGRYHSVLDRTIASCALHSTCPSSDGHVAFKGESEQMKHSIRTSVVVLVVALLASTLALSASPTATEAGLRKVALGVSVAVADSQSVAVVDDYTSRAGRAPAIWTVWSDWGGGDAAFPTSFLNGLRSHYPGTVPMVNWEPVDPANQVCSQWSLDNIINGDHDAYIRAWATAAKAYGGRVILRFAHEMNGYWFIWGYSRCTNTPAKFKAAWQHVWNIFRGPNGVGATNVKFLWSIYGAFKLRAHYPGNSYVDYVGLTAFNWGPSGSNNNQPWLSMVANFKPSMKALAGLTSKPVIAAEFGAANVPDCGACDKPAYLTNGYPAVYAKWPRLKAIVYFDLDMRFVNQPDFRLSSPPAALTAYRAIVAQPKFQGTIP